MRSSTFSAVALLALGASALPTPDTTDATHYTLTIKNNCKETKQFGTFQITPTFQMNKMSEIVPIASNHTGQIKVPFNALGVRLSAQADNTNQWAAQQLVEFGYSAFMGLTGLAYDLSSIGVTDTVPMSVCPSNKNLANCACKTMKGNNVAESLSQVWTAASQVADGSPADTTCMSGKQDFDIEWC